jgi:hypothetical protein
VLIVSEPAPRRHSTLVCERLPEGSAELELIHEALYAFYILYRFHDVADFVAKSDTAQRDPVVCGEHLNSATVCDGVIELGRYPRREQMVRPWSDASFVVR